MSWTDKRVEKLEKLWKEGKSAAEIAKSLGGVTRNAVIGKAHRLGLSGRPQASTSKKETKKAAPKKAVAKSTAQAKKTAKAASKSAKKETKSTAKTAKKAETAAAPKAPSVPVFDEAELNKPSNGLTILDLNERVCKWPIGDPRYEDFHFCGAASRPGTPYCEHHAAMAYQSSGSRRSSSEDGKGKQAA